MWFDRNMKLLVVLVCDSMSELISLLSVLWWLIFLNVVWIVFVVLYYVVVCRLLVSFVSV